MNFRSQTRALFIRASTLVRADELLLRLRRRKGPWALVVGIHETPASLQEEFRKQLEWVSRHFTITTFEAFATIWASPEVDTASKPLVLFTFDDGRESNFTVGAPLLESFGGRGLFFIVPAFAECSSENALAFYRSRINPNSKPGDEKWEDWRPMCPAQIAELAARGHAIGNHTLTHPCLVGLSSNQLEQEIGDSARKLSAWTNKSVDAFAWTFGWDGIDANARQVVQRHHRFCFSPCAGTIDPLCDSPHLLWRREIEVKYSAAEYRFLYSGLVDPWWSDRRRRLRQMLRTTHA